MTPAQIETAARRRLNALNDTFWSSEEILSEALYGALLEIATECRCIQASDTASSVASQEAYDFPSRAFEIVEVKYDGKKLGKISERVKHSVDVPLDTSVTTGVPSEYRIWNEQILLHPVPDSIKTIAFRSYKYPAVPTATSTLELNPAHHMRLVSGVAFYMVMKEPEDPRLKALSDLWERDKSMIISLEAKRKRADKFTRVHTEEELLQTHLGYV